jgi:hypothetical protein
MGLAHGNLFRVLGFSTVQNSHLFSRGNYSQGKLLELTSAETALTMPHPCSGSATDMNLVSQKNKSGDTTASSTLTKATSLRASGTVRLDRRCGLYQASHNEMQTRLDYIV